MSVIIRTGLKSAMLQIAIVRGCQGVVENHTCGNGGELTQFIQGTGHICIGGSPGVAAAAGIAGFGNPHLTTGNIAVTLGGILPGAVGRNSQILFAQDSVIRAETTHGSTTLGNTVIVVIAEYIHLGLIIAQQGLGGNHIKACSHTAASSIVAQTEHIDIADSAGTHKQALRVVLLQPCTKQVTLGKTRKGDQGGFVGEFGSRNGNTVFFGSLEQQFCLVKGHGFVRCMDTGTVGDGHQQFAINSFDKVQQAQPLFLGQYILEALGSFTIALAVEVIVGPSSFASLIRR